MIETVEAPVPVAYEESTGDLKPSASIFKAVNPLDVKPRKRVTINGKVKIREIPHLNDTDEEVIAATFLTQDDYANFKKSYTVIVRKMMKLKETFVSDDGENCSRGLEFRTKEGARKRKRTKKAAIDAVLDEQDIQREDGMIDPFFIADVYRAVTSPCRMAALSRGLNDEKVMLDYLDPEEKAERQRARDVGTKKKDILKTPPKRNSMINTMTGEEQLRRLVQPK